MEHLNEFGSIDISVHLLTEQSHCTPIESLSDFYSFPEIHGWIVRKAYTLEKLHGLSDTKPLMKSGLLQSWLFFGLIFFVVRDEDGPILNFEDLLDRDEKTYLNTALLPGALEKWAKWELENRETAEIRLIQAELALEYARRIVQTNCTASDTFDSPGWPDYLSDRISLSLMVLGETLTAAKARILHTLGSKLRGWHKDDEGDWGPPGYVIEQMSMRKWCPRTVHILQGQLNSNATLLLAAFESCKSVELTDSHQSCTKDACLASSERTKSKYRHKHASGCLGQNCIMVGLDMAKVYEILGEQTETNEGHKFPVIEVRESPDNTLEMAVSAWTLGDNTPFATISYVSDGLGNPDGNEIYYCQLKFISSLLNKVAQSSNESFHAKTMPFWMDTLLIPKHSSSTATDSHSTKSHVDTPFDFDDLKRRAIRQTKSVFESSAHCIVIDGDLLNTDSRGTPSKNVMKILASGWMRRLWTLQEAFLSKQLWITFKQEGPAYTTGIKNFDELIHSMTSMGTFGTPMAEIVRLKLFRNVMGYAREHRKGGKEHLYSAGAMLVADTWRAAKWRTTSNPAHETLALATLLGLNYRKTSINQAGLADIREVTASNSDKLEVMMCDFLRLLDISFPGSIPPGMIFLPGERLSKRGFGWAPKTWMSAVEIDYPDPLSTFNSIAALEEDGLLVQYPGFLLHFKDQDRRRILGTNYEDTVFTFPVDRDLLEWFSVTPADEERKESLYQFLEQSNGNQTELAIILSRPQPKEMPLEIGLLVEIYEKQRRRREGELEKAVYCCRIIHRVRVWRRKPFYRGGPFCFGESLDPDQKWLVDSFVQPKPFGIGEPVEPEEPLPGNDGRSVLGDLLEVLLIKPSSYLSPSHSKPPLPDEGMGTAITLSQNLEPARKEQLTGPHLFVQHPKLYLEDVQNLQEKVFKLAEPALRHIEKSGNTHILPLPLLAVFNTHESDDRVQLLVNTNMDLISAISEGQNILAAEEFSSTTYNIIVHDPDRKDVLRVVPIKKDTLQVLTHLMQEFESYFVPPREDNLLDEILDDIDEAVRLILCYLGLNVPPTTTSTTPLHIKLDQVFNLVFSTLSVLFLGLVSFIGSHLCLEHVPGALPSLATFTQLAIEVSGGHFLMKPQRLLCLDAFVKNPVWTFSTVPELHDILDVVEAKGYYLSIFLADFADLWGPVQLQFFGDSTELVSEITVRGGRIKVASPENRSIITRENEVFCHWHSWMDLESDGLGAQPKHMSTVQRLLIGAPDDDNFEAFNNRALFVPNEICDCTGGERYSDTHDVFELQTSPSSWELATRTGQISGGLYVVPSFGQQWKFNTAWTLKDVIVFDWVDEIRESAHSPKPFYLDYRVVLSISKCTGHTRRIILWDFLKEDVLRGYLQQVVKRKIYRKFKFLVKYFLPNTSFVEVWRSVTTAAQETLKTIAKVVLAILRSTGVVEDGYLQAWDVASSINRLDGRKVKPSWSAMVKDDSACATFAIITDKCIKFAGPARPSSPAPTSSVFNTILNTAVCITSPEPLVNEEYHVYTFPNQLQDDRHRPEWAMDSATFKKWKVQLSEDYSSSLEVARRQRIESTRDQTGPDPEDIQRIVSRQSARQLRDPKRHQKNKLATIRPPQSQQQAHGATASRLPNNSPPDERNNLPGEPMLGSSSKTGQRLPYDGALEVKNSAGEIIGWLVLDPPRSIDLYTVREGSSFTARWEERKLGLLSSIEAKEKTVDLKIVRWAERKGGVLPWAVSKVAERYNEGAKPFVVEHVRGGNLKKDQKVLQTYIW